MYYRTLFILGTVATGHFTSPAYAQTIDSCADDIICQNILPDEFAYSGEDRIEEAITSLPGVNGRIVDDSFSGLVLDGGPGAFNLNLRGMGAERTVIAIDGNRLTLSGVEGAPFAPNLELVPMSFISAYHLNADTNTANFGADVIGGRLNLDFKSLTKTPGLEVQASLPFDGGGESIEFSGEWGWQSDRLQIGIFGALSHRERLGARERDPLACDKYYDIDENSQIRTERPANIGQGTQATRCIISTSTNRILFRGADSLYYVGEGDGLSGSDFAARNFLSVPIDLNADGFSEIQLEDYQRQSDPDLVSEAQQVSFMVNAEYDFDSARDLALSTRLWVTRRDVDVQGNLAQLFPWVPADNLFNPCNSLAGGVDCNLARNEIINNPIFRARFTDYYNDPNLGSANCFNLGRENCTLLLDDNLFAPAPQLTVRPIVTLHNDRENTKTETDFLYFNTALSGAMPSPGGDPDWAYEISANYQISDGESTRQGIDERRLALSLGWDPTTPDFDIGIFETLTALSAPCSPDTSGPLPANILEGCVAVNLFADSVFDLSGGAFSSAAEADYLFASRVVETTLTQTVLTGQLGGPVNLLGPDRANLYVGGSWRYEDIDSAPNSFARNGELIGFLRDLGASGDHSILELFSDINFNLFETTSGLGSADIDVSARYIEHDLAGSDIAWHSVATWQPIESLTLFASTDKSVRTPNLRELYLSGVSGFQTITDPCAVTNFGSFVFLNSQQGCIASVFDPGFAFNTTRRYSVENLRAGSLSVDGEGVSPQLESVKSQRWGFTFHQPFTERLEASISFSQWKNDFDRVISPLSPQYVLSECYDIEPRGGGENCARITRNPQTGRITQIRSTYGNFEGPQIEGMDVSFRYGQDFHLLGRSIRLAANGEITHISRRDVTEFDFSSRDFVTRNAAGEFNFPEFKSRSQVRLTSGPWTAALTNEYIDDLIASPSNQTTLSDFFYSCPLPEDGECRPVDFAQDYWLHHMSLQWASGDITMIGGLRNIFNTSPPRVGNTVSSRDTIPLGQGYDNLGRTFFIKASKSF